MSANTFDSSFTVALTQKPLGALVSLYLSAQPSNMRFSQNIVNFTAQNWNTVRTLILFLIQLHSNFKTFFLQPVTIAVALGSDRSVYASGKATIIASANAPCESFNQCSNVLPVTVALPSPAGTCVSYGDPHYRTFSTNVPYPQKPPQPCTDYYTCGLCSDPSCSNLPKKFRRGGAAGPSSPPPQYESWQYTYNIAGYYQMVQSKWLNVQVFQRATFDVGYGINFVTDSIFISWTNDYNFKNNPPYLAAPIITKLSNGPLLYMNYTMQNQIWTFRLLDGTVLEVGGPGNSDGWFEGHVGARITVPEMYRGQVNGLCNRLDGSNQLFAQNGAAINSLDQGQVDAFGRSWAVPDQNSIFLGKQTIMQNPFNGNGAIAQGYVPSLGVTNPTFNQICCPVGQTLINNACSCPPGQVLINNECKCPQGNILIKFIFLLVNI
jgi:hypothetical protein